MKRILSLSLFSVFFLPLVSLAQSYPTSCPETAQSILNAVGGCSIIDAETYSNIYAKCCVTVASNSNLIIYLVVAVLVVALVIWLILTKRKNKISIS